MNGHTLYTEQPFSSNPLTRSYQEKEAIGIFSQQHPPGIRTA